MKISIVTLRDFVKIPDETKPLGDNTLSLDAKRHAGLEMEETPNGILGRRFGQPFLVPWSMVRVVHYEMIAPVKKASK